MVKKAALHNFLGSGSFVILSMLFFASCVSSKEMTKELVYFP